MSTPPSRKIKVTVNFAGHVHDLIGEKMVELELTDKTLKGLLEKLTSLYGEGLRRIILKDTTRELILQVLLNGMDIDFLEGLETPLKEGDRIDILPLVAGGSMRFAEKTLNRRRVEGGPRS